MLHHHHHQQHIQQQQQQQQQQHLRAFAASGAASLWLISLPDLRPSCAQQQHQRQKEDVFSSSWESGMVQVHFLRTPCLPCLFQGPITTTPPLQVPRTSHKPSAFYTFLCLCLSLSLSLSLCPSLGPSLSLCLSLSISLCLCLSLSVSLPLSLSLSLSLWMQGDIPIERDRRRKR